MNADITAPSREFRQRLSASRRGARLARRLAQQQLADWGMPYDSECSESVAAVVAELAANAATHGHVTGRDFELRLVLGSQAVRVEVADARAERRPPAQGQVVAPGPEAEAGRGLLLVEALALAWGVAERAVGKTVWAEVPTAPGA